MRAAVYDRYGPPDVVRIEELPDPEPKDDEVRVRVRATTVSSGDYRLRSMDVPFGFRILSRLLFGIFRPRKRVLGTELCGEVEAVGSAVRDFAPGDRVVAFRGAAMGCHAELVCVPQDGAIVRAPTNLDDGEAAALSFGGTTALDFLRRANVAAGERVLVNGASGAVGTAAVQLAKNHFGAHVTGVCSGANAELVRSIGADRVIDYTKDDFTAAGETWDVIVDTVGTAPYGRSKRALAPSGRLVLIFARLTDMLAAPWIGLFGKRRVVTGVAAERAEDVRLLAELAEAGTFRPVVDRRFPFGEIVEAHRRVDGGHKRGSVVVTFGASGAQNG